MLLPEGQSSRWDSPGRWEQRTPQPEGTAAPLKLPPPSQPRARRSRLRPNGRPPHVRALCACARPGTQPRPLRYTSFPHTRRDALTSLPASRPVGRWLLAAGGFGAAAPSSGTTAGPAAPGPEGAAGAFKWSRARRSPALERVGRGRRG